MSVFCLFFIALPALVYVIIYSFRHEARKSKKATTSIFKAPIQEQQQYLLLSSCSYFALVALYTLLLRGGSLHSLCRFILASPMFFIVFILLWENKPGAFSFKKPSLLFALPLAALMFFLHFVDYGGSRFSFEYVGMFILILLAALLYFIPLGAKPFTLLLWGGAFIINVVWVAYLFNDFLCGGWIFT